MAVPACLCSNFLILGGGFLFLIIIPFFLDFVAVVQPEISRDYFSHICCSHKCQTVGFIISQKGSAGFDGVDHTPNSANAI